MGGSVGPAGVAGLLLGTACWLSQAAPPRLGPPGCGRASADLRVVGWVRTGRERWSGWRRGRRRSDDAAELAALTERLAALSRAGVGQQRAWQVLAVAAGPGAGAAAVVAGMVAGGGSVADGLCLAARLDRPGSRIGWLAVVYRVAERSGAPASALLDRFAQLVRAELGREQDRAVALAGPSTTAALLSALPIAAPLLGWLMGADPVRVLGGSGVGRLCLLAGIGFWLAGRAWSQRLVEASRRAGR